MNITARILRILIFGVALGGVGSLCAIAFVEAIKWLNAALFVTASSRRAVAPDFAMWLIIVPALGGLIAGGLLLLLPDRRPHTPADVIQAAQSGKNVSPRAGLVTVGAVLAGLGSGASVGQYGPLVHLGATIGSLASRLGKVEPALGIGCGVAAAIATAFSAPLAGIIFAHEVVLRHYSLRAFAPITVASSTGFFIAEKVFHRPPLLEVLVSREVVAAEFFAFILIGIGGALVAVLYMRGILRARELGAWLRLPCWLKPALAGLTVGITAQWIPEVLGVGQETLRLAVTPDAYTAAELAVILIAKIAATALCIGFGIAGGVFSPALLIGILYGALLGTGAEFLLGDLHAGLEFYAICGMAAVVSPVIGAPLATILIVFELTRNYALTTAVMVSVVFANLVAYRLFGRSLFDRELLLRGFDLSMGRDKVMLDARGVGEYLTTDFVRAQPDDALATVQKKLIAAERSEACIVDAAGKYLGVVTLNDTVANTVTDGASDTVTARDYIRGDWLCFTDSMTVWDAMAAMDEFVGESIPVTDAHGVLLGVVYESALVRAYLHTAKKLRAEEHAAH